MAAIAALSMTACGQSGNDTANSTTAGSDSAKSDLKGTLTIGGASSTGAAREAWEAKFQEANSGVTINYASTGSGAGRKNFIDGALDFAGSDAFLKDEELAGEFKSCKAGTKAIDVPIYISPIALAFKLDGVKELKMDAPTVAKIFKKQITKWNDDAIKALNPDAKLPDLAITAVVRSDESGTTENFTDWMNQNAPEVWTDKKSGKSIGETVKGLEAAEKTQGVFSAVNSGNGTIGYMDLSAVTGDTLGMVNIKVGEKFQKPTADAASKVLNVSKQVEGRGANDVAINLDRKTGADGAYPLVLVSYAVACQEYADAAKGELVKSYLSYIVSDEGQNDAHEVAGTAPLSGDVATKAKDAINSIK